MKQSILRAHFTSCHFKSSFYFMHDDHRYLLAKCTRFHAAGTLQSLGLVSKYKSALEASYRVAWRIAEDKKHTIGERFIKPCAMDMVEFVYRKEQKKKIEKIFLSNDTVHCRISDMFQDALDQIAEEI